MSMRTHYCGQTTEAALDQTVSLCGWVHRRRDHGGVIFIDLRDREGLVQVVCAPEQAEVLISPTANSTPATFKGDKASGLINSILLNLAGLAAVALQPEGPGEGAELAVLDADGIGITEAAESVQTVDRIKNVAQQSFDYAVQNPRLEGLTRMQLGKDAEVQATRWLRRWAERNDVGMGSNGLEFQAKGANSIPDFIYHPEQQIFDFKLTPNAIRSSQTQNFKLDFPGYNINYIFGP